MAEGLETWDSQTAYTLGQSQFKVTLLNLQIIHAWLWFVHIYIFFYADYFMHLAILLVDKIYIFVIFSSGCYLAHFLNSKLFLPNSESKCFSRNLSLVLSKPEGEKERGREREREFVAYPASSAVVALSSPPLSLSKRTILHFSLSLLLLPVCD